MKKGILAFAFLAVLGVPLAATADPITGVLNVTGTVEISSGSIAFANDAFYINNPATSQQGGFTALAGTQGMIDNITNPPDTTGALDVPDFMTFDAAPNITFTLTYLLPGIDGSTDCTSPIPAAGQVCTPDLLVQSPFDLANMSATSSIASFSILGVEVDSLTGDTVPVTGVFTIPLSDESFQKLLATIAGGGTVTSSFAAQFSTPAAPSPAPEPGVLLMLAIGMMGLVGLKSARSTARNSTES
ncbi:MAG: hypothetical protein WBF06_01365 [Candidatus Acidiferrales bacterium]